MPLKKTPETQDSYKIPTQEAQQTTWREPSRRLEALRAVEVEKAGAAVFEGSVRLRGWLTCFVEEARVEKNDLGEWQAEVMNL